MLAFPRRIKGRIQRTNFANCASSPVNRAGQSLPSLLTTHPGKRGDREQFQLMFAAASRREFDVILFWSLDRFSREGVLATLQYLQNLTAYGVGYRSYTEQYLDSCGMFRDAVISILATVAKQERVSYGKKTIAGLATVPGSRPHWWSSGERRVERPR